MKASTLIKRIQKAIDKHGDLGITAGFSHFDKLTIKKSGPYSPHSTPRTRNKCFLEIEAEDL